jgi:hypothetical protein
MNWFANQVNKFSATAKLRAKVLLLLLVAMMSAHTFGILLPLTILYRDALIGGSAVLCCELARSVIHWVAMRII